jgi:hypothetical protein
MIRKHRDVGRTFAKAGNAQGDDVEAEIQVLAERASPDFGAEVAVGGCQDADVDAHGRAAADTVDLAFLEDAQKFRLQPDVHLADLVEQQGAAVRGLELAHATGQRAAERALLVPEQLAFQEVLGDRGAVHGDERPLRAAGAAVDVTREHFLAGARLASDQHGGFGARHLLGAADRRLHGGVAHHQRMALAGRRFEDRGDQLGVRRQRQELARAVADGADGGIRIVPGATGHHGDGDAFGDHGADQPADVAGEVAQHEVNAGVGAHPGEAGFRVVRLFELGTARHRDAGGVAELAGKRTDDQHAHGRASVMARDRP